MHFHDSPFGRETPNRQWHERPEGLGRKVTAVVDVATYRKNVLGLKPSCYIWQHLEITTRLDL